MATLFVMLNRNRVVHRAWFVLNFALLCFLVAIKRLFSEKLNGNCSRRINKLGMNKISK